MNKDAFRQLDKLLRPRSVALIGTTPRVNFYWLRSFLNFGFKGKIYPVNPHLDQAVGLKCYHSILEVPGPVDFAVLRVPAPIVPDIIDQCIEKGVRLVTIFSSGFSELGTPEGRRLEAQIAAKIRSSPLRALGPNCMGVCCPETGLSFRPDFTPHPGHIAFISQSGGKAIDFYLSITDAGLGISKIFSYGNEADLTSHELLEYLNQDPKTHIIAMYIEGTRNGPRLRQVLTATAPNKPLIVWKAGRTPQGAKAAASHSAALAGTPQIWDALLKQTGAAQAHSFQQLIDTTIAFARCPPPRGNRVALITISGGAGVAGTDTITSHGLTLPPLTTKTTNTLNRTVNQVGTNTRNPIDLAASYYDPQVTAQALQTIAQDPHIDALILEAAPHHITFIEHHLQIKNFAQTFWQNIAQAANTIIHTHHKPILIAVPTIGYPQATQTTRQQLNQANLPTFPTTNHAAQALQTLTQYHQRHPNLKLPPLTPPTTKQ